MAIKMLRTRLKYARIDAASRFLEMENENTFSWFVIPTKSAIMWRFVENEHSLKLIIRYQTLCPICEWEQVAQCSQNSQSKEISARNSIAELADASQGRGTDTRYVGCFSASLRFLFFVFCWFLFLFIYAFILLADHRRVAWIKQLLGLLLLHTRDTNSYRSRDTFSQVFLCCGLGNWLGQQQQQNGLVVPSANGCA